MRLHRLLCRAFGPFGDEIEIDFDRLSHAGIFLIHGPTGGGKTSILDALCFALYADVPGARPAGRSLQSQHAPSGSVPEVSVEFTAGGRRLRVTRSPEFVRAKKRGTGDTVVPAKVLVEEAEGAGWRAVTTRSDEAGLVVRRAVGLGLDQFSRVVLLPQGEFATFLRATPEDRRAVLERLFDVSRYGQIEAWLVEQRREADHAVSATQHQVDAALHRLNGLIELLPETSRSDFPELSADMDGLGDVVSRLIGATHQHAAEQAARRDRADARLRAAEDALRANIPLVTAYDRGAAAEATLAALAEREPTLLGQAEQLAAHERARTISGDLRALERATRQHEAARTSAQAALRASAREFPGVGAFTDLSAFTHEGSEVMSLVSGRSAPIGRLQHLSRRATDVAGVVARCKQELTTAEARATAADHAHTSVHKHAEQTRVEVAVAEAAVARTAYLQQQHTEAARILEVRTEWEQAREEHRVAADAALAATESAQRAGTELLELQRRRIEGMAGELAAGLSPGMPCTVCGSVEHPRPASAGEVVTAAEVSTAQEAFDRAHDLATQAASDVARWAAVVGAKAKDLGEDTRDRETLVAALEAVATELAAVETEGARLAAAVARQQESSLRAEQAVTTRTTALEAVGAARGLLTAARADREQVRGELAAALAEHADCPCELALDGPRGVRGQKDCLNKSDDPDDSDDTDDSDDSDDSGQLLGLICEIEETVSRHGRLATLLETAAANQQSVSAAASDVADLTGILSDRCAALGFSAISVAQSALLSDTEAQAITDALRTTGEQRATALATLAEPEVVAAQSRPRPDLDVLAAAADAAKTALLIAGSEETVASAAARDADAVGATVLELAARWTQQVHTARTISHLADTVTGIGADNALRMRLSAFVLAGRLERIVDLANERLAVIASGRYRLAHTDALSGSGRRSGLGLTVHDQWTGATRDPATLSGGEAFMASLALALGLADAVHLEAGGVDLQTLFIDEGFGTLDDESLEQVMGVLDTLREGGRSVGVVSHVADLRSRIPVQLRVDKTTVGSTVAVLSQSA
jgi:exonuclease SbcC